jgi:hypothetical protein
MPENDMTPKSDELFALVVRKQLGAVYGGPHHGTEFSLADACPKCGTGAEQVGPLRLRRFTVPHAEAFLTLDDDVLVRQPLADRLHAEGVTALDVVVDARSGQPLGILQLRPEATLPRFGPGTTGVTRERPCVVCNRDGHYGIPHVPYGFRYASLDDSLRSRDVLATYERFGTSVLRQPFIDSVFAAPVLIVGHRVAAALEAARLRDIELHPVDIG